MAQQSSAGPNHLLIITDDQPHYMQNANITPPQSAKARSSTQPHLMIDSYM